jgi:hypothetical protein
LHRGLNHDASSFWQIAGNAKRPATWFAGNKSVVRFELRIIGIAAPEGDMLCYTGCEVIADNCVALSAISFG